MNDFFKHFSPETYDCFGASENKKATLDDVASNDTDTMEKLDKDVVQLDKDVCTLTGITKGLGDGMTNPDGSFIDIADKEGRKADREFMLGAQKEMTEFIDDLPNNVTAKLHQDDRKRIDLVNKNFKTNRRKDRLLLVLAGFIIAIAANSALEYGERSKELETWYNDKDVSVAFGEYIMEQNPGLYEYYKSGRWQKSVAYRDSVWRAHAWKEWDKQVKKGK